MKPLNKKSPNCIANPAECVQWNSGNIEYLGICNGDYLPQIIWEIVNKLQAIAGQDLSGFDIDGILAVCNQKAPVEVNLITILTLLANNDVCLKDYIITLQEQILELGKDKNINVNLKCLGDFDQFGNQLSITRDQLDQKVIDAICLQQSQIANLQTQINEVKQQIVDQVITIEEPEFATCVDPVVKSTSQQTISVANKVCDMDAEISTATIPTALAKTPLAWTTPEYTGIVGWITSISPVYGTLAGNYNNLLLAYEKLRSEVADILSTCCAPTCDKIKIGFSVVEDPGGAIGDYVVRFRPQDGTQLFGFGNPCTLCLPGPPDSGCTGCSRVTFDGFDKTTGAPVTILSRPINVHEVDWTDNVYNFSGFSLIKPITVTLQARLSKDGLTCEKCISQTIDLSSGCPVCQVTASGIKGQPGTLTITYEY